MHDTAYDVAHETHGKYEHICKYVSANLCVVPCSVWHPWVSGRTKPLTKNMFKYLDLYFIWIHDQKDIAVIEYLQYSALLWNSVIRTERQVNNGKICPCASILKNIDNENNDNEVLRYIGFSNPICAELVQFTTSNLSLIKMVAISQTPFSNAFLWSKKHEFKCRWSLFVINDTPALVQIMALRRPGDKPLSEPMLTRFTDAYMRHLGTSVKYLTAYYIIPRHWCVVNCWHCRFPDRDWLNQHRDYGMDK